MTQPPMPQPPYRPPQGDPMSRFALFAAALIVLVALGAQTSRSASIKSMCVCVPTRARLMVKSVKSTVARTQVRSTALFTAFTASAASVTQ